MPYTAPHNVLQVFGSIVSESEPEQWTFGLRFGEGNYLAGSDVPETLFLDDQDILDDIEADLTTWWNANSTSFARRVKWEGFKFNGVGVDGKYVNGERTLRRDLAFPLEGASGGGSGGMMPPQIATAVTFRTNAARGLAARGRIYLPPLGSTLASDNGRLADAAADQFASTTAQLLTDLSNWEGIESFETRDPGKVCVMSKVREGATRRVNRVDVGDVFDTIRSRSEALIEHRSPAYTVDS